MAPAPISGTFLAPGVSKNGRLYTRDAITKAVNRMQERIADPTGLPITMRTHHAAEDDSTRIAAVVTKVAVSPDGVATWEAYPANTTAGREIAGATQPGVDGKRPLAAVSIRGWWADTVRNTDHDGRTVETADDFEVDGIDFTANPGVDAARISTFAKMAAESHGHRAPITESADAALADTITADEAYITVSGNDADYDSDVRITAYVGDDQIATSAATAGAAAQAALDVLNAADDGDESGASGASCGNCGSTMPADANYCPTCGSATGGGNESAPTGTTLTETQENTMANTPATETKPTEAATGEPVAEKAPVAETATPAVTPAPVTEAASTGTLTEAVVLERVQTAVREATPGIIESLGATMVEKIAEATDAIRAEVLAAYGPPPRKGLIEAAGAAEAVDFSTMSEEQFRKAQAATWDDVYPSR